MGLHLVPHSICLQDFPICYNTSRKENIATPNHTASLSKPHFFPFECKFWWRISTFYKLNRRVQSIPRSPGLVGHKLWRTCSPLSCSAWVLSQFCSRDRPVFMQFGIAVNFFPAGQPSNDGNRAPLQLTDSGADRVLCWFAIVWCNHVSSFASARVRACQFLLTVVTLSLRVSCHIYVANTSLCVPRLDATVLWRLPTGIRHFCRQPPLWLSGRPPVIGRHEFSGRLLG